MRVDTSGLGERCAAETAGPARSRHSRGRPGDGSPSGCRAPSAVAVLGVLACLLAGCQQPLALWPAALRGYTPPSHGNVLDATDMLPAEQCRGPGYTVAPTAAVVDHNAMFCVQTRYGTMSAHGRNMLELRCYETRCIEQAARMRGVRQVLEGALASLDETVEGAETLLLDPIGSANRAPKGLDRMVRSQLDSASRRAGSPERRQLAVSLGCDPETHNRILDRMLDEIEIQRLLGSVPVQFIPYTGILRLTADILDEVGSTPPHEINKRIERELAAKGAAEPLRRDFCRSRHFTTVERLLFMKQYDRLEGVTNREALLGLAVEGKSEVDALAAIETAHALAAVHQRRPMVGFARRGLLLACPRTQGSDGLLGLLRLPIPGLEGKPVSAGGGVWGLPVAVLREGTHLIYAPCDCLEKTPHLEDAIRAYRADFAGHPTTLVCSGRVMPDARGALETAGFTVNEGARAGPDWGETGSALEADTAPLKPPRFRLPF